MGIETEYGVLQPGKPMANPMLLSSQVVTTYRALVARGDGARGRARWDYDDEDPLQDARGFHVPRASAHPSLLTDDPTRPAPSGPVAEAGAHEPAEGSFQEVARPTTEEYDDPSAANVILTNGARLYVDHAHPEYSSPEVTVPHDVVGWDVAGERVMLAASRELDQVPGGSVVLYKNNVDGKGASYGTHENFLVDRSVPFGVLVEMLTPFLVTRQVFAGSGRVGLGPTGEEHGFQVSQRADYVEAEVGLETTLRRPIVNTRDEPHADRQRWRRLHLIIGDANMLETATYLKTGTTSLVLFVVEHLEELGAAVRTRLAALRLADPVGDVQRVSRDLDLTTRLALADGRRLTAIEVQREYLDVAQDAAERLAGTDGVDAPTRDVLARWRSVLDRLATDRDACARDVEWVAKLRLLDRLRERDGLDWGHPRLAAMDLQWSDVRPERGIYHRLLAAGAVDRVVTEREVGAAVHHAPEDTRAFFRGEVMARYGDQVSAASWDSVIFDVPGAPSLQRVPMMDPLRGTRAHIGALLDASPDAASLLAGLAGPS
ncbi:depupylase/deamidase Dop [Cellulosimicrobium composti]|uniref:Proteasome accessory factor PafA2 n=1 Tax=Cellulosimicrobium composti TaxID=2672572 RepID=A0A6N7ZIP8_9MICO|nr:depupylase/deamidase Dop [Cellulosimicrobium composti]MTG89375.1 proteasome accessory factor PafA2 [Cellulosimicrobium composti]NDO87936.1 proteasome accessory factor PafA2 [Cellulosimicrobium composti]TWG87185.1 proteasome accessory factor A [Cellulosimicrobium cellulans J34]SMF20673.1 proteasome accessory factor A [Cellulosimicrobium cellulans J1]